MKDTSEIDGPNGETGNVIKPQDPKSTTSSPESSNVSSSVVDTSESTVKALSNSEIELDCGTADVKNVGSKNDDWYEAIEAKDCNKLGEMLWGAQIKDKRKKLLRGKGKENRNALHVACMQGCYRLVMQILDSSSENDWLLREEDGRSGLTAYEIADATGNRSTERYLFYRRFPGQSWHVLSKAHEESDWNNALVQRDCSSLRALLMMNSRYLLEYSQSDAAGGENDGLTVLDVAVEENDMALVVTVKRCFNANRTICWGDESYYPSELSWDVLIEGYKRGPAMELARKLGRDEVVKELSQRRGFGDEDEATSSVYKDVADAANEFIDRVWNKEWDASYGADVDYNFEDGPRRSLLRMHFIFKDFEKIRRAFRSLEKRGSFGILQRSLHDGQGRTLFLTMLDSLDKTKIDDLLSHFADGPLHSKCLLSLLWPRHLRGSSSSMRAIIYDYLNEGCHYSSELYPRTHVINYHFCDSHNDNPHHVGQLATYLENWCVVERIIQDQGFKINELKLPIISIVASFANQTVLWMLMKANFDPMVVDGYGKTSLHYAANPRSAEFKVPHWYFSSMELYEKVKDQWSLRRKEDKSDANRRACILMLLRHGVDLSQEDHGGSIPDPGPRNDAAFPAWWYELLFKDTTDKKSSLNQAGNALSVVGTLVAATSYVGPLQPPMGLNDGYLSTNKVLIRMFVVTNSLAFYLAIASVMFAVVPSLPMPQEGMMEELARAQHTVSFSLSLLLASIVCIIISFASATAAVMDSDETLQFYFLLLSPSIVGWFFCLVAIVIFFIR